MAILRFDCFELDLATEELRRNAMPVKLAPQPSKVLVTLALRAGCVVSRDELRERIWSDDTHVDFNGSLHSCIKQIRAALDDDAGAPRFIETLPRRGYRFLREVERDAVSPGAVAARRRPRTVIALAAAAVALLAISVSALFDEPKRPSTAPRLVVLPFEVDEGGDAAVGQALAEEVTSRLASLDPTKLAVLAPSTAARYRARSQDIDVTFVLEGKLGGPANELDVELVRAGDQERLWRGRVTFGDGPWAGELTAALVPYLISEPVEPREDDDVSPEAYEAYLRGRYLLQKPDAVSARSAAEEFRRALTLNAFWAPPHLGLAEASLRSAWLAREGSVDDYTMAARSAERALALERSGEAEYVLALALWYGQWDWEGAGRSFQRALLMSPGLARAHHWYAYYLSALGRHEEAIFEIGRALELDPLSPAVQSDVGWFYYFAGRYEEAVDASRRTLALEPKFTLAQDCIVESYVAQGDEARARMEALRMLELAEAPAKVLDAVSSPRDHARALATFWAWRLERATTLPDGGEDAYSAAVAALRLGGKADSLRWLETAETARNPWMPMLDVDPRLEPLRSDRGFARLRMATGRR